MVKKNIDPNVVLKIETKDTRSYHISSKKIKDIIGFETNLTIEDAVQDLKKAFEKKLLINTFNNELFFNIKECRLLN